jgi:hypothetical protein
MSKMKVGNWEWFLLFCWIFLLGFFIGSLSYRAKTKPLIATYEKQINIVIQQRDQAKGELATFQAIVKQMVEGGQK